MARDTMDGCEENPPAGAKIRSGLGKANDFASVLDAASKPLNTKDTESTENSQSKDFGQKGERFAESLVLGIPSRFNLFVLCDLCGQFFPSYISSDPGVWTESVRHEFATNAKSLRN
jgi:hypothetical protein